MAGYQTEDSGRKIRRQRYKQAHVYMSRSEEHTSELQSQSNLVCRLLLEKKKKNKYRHAYVRNLISITPICWYPATKSAVDPRHRCHRAAGDKIVATTSQVQVVTDTPSC